MADIIAADGKAIAVQGDVSKAADIEQLFAATKKAYGKENILVNNAGIYQFAPLGQITEASFHQMFDINVLGVVLTTQEALKLIGDEGASIVNISSAVTRLLPATGSLYSASKAAGDAITITFSKELRARKIRVNSINPGMVETEGLPAAGFKDSPIEQAMVARTPLGRIGQPGDIASVAVFLASEDSKYITGEIVNVAGGIR